tara:strand:+ start:271 stop:876 length:606 start_codon:yes stop_codon:yes gene_type:complete
MRFLIDGSSARLKDRRRQGNELIAGQLLTPLTGYKRCEEVFGIDNGGFSGAKPKGFARIIKRQWEFRGNCVFAAVPDKIENHKETLAMWEDYNHLADGYKKAFVIQDGFDGWPDNADAIFLGGSTKFKDSYEAEQIVKEALKNNMHVHIGRVNTFYRFYHFHCMGAHTCDGSGVSIYNDSFQKLLELCRKPDVRVQKYLPF